MLAEERHRKICETVLSRGTVTTVELMELLDASESTVRRDLAELEQRRRLVRVHGGASRIGNGYVLRDQALDEKHFLHAGEKQTIASFAASLIKPGDFVYLDAGSTTEALADCIEERDATYLTNSLPIARKLLARGCKTLLPGGTVKPLTEALVGEETIASLTKYHFTIGFWGTNGFSPKTGFTTPELSEAKVKEFSIAQTLKQAREARIGILRKMLAAAPRPAENISEYAPRLLRTKIDPDKIGTLIGPGGKTIRGIQESTGASVSVDDDGSVVIAANDLASAEAALDVVNRMFAAVEIGKTYEGVVSTIQSFGAFIEILPGREGLCHISELSDGFIDNIQKFCKVGDKIEVKVIGIDDQKRIKLSRRAVLKERGETDRPEGEADMEMDERPRRDERRDDRRYRDDLDGRDERREPRDDRRESRRPPRRRPSRDDY